MVWTWIFLNLACNVSHIPTYRNHRSVWVNSHVASSTSTCIYTRHIARVTGILILLWVVDSILYQRQAASTARSSNRIHGWTEKSVYIFPFNRSEVAGCCSVWRNRNICSSRKHESKKTEQRQNIEEKHRSTKMLC